MKVRRQKRGPPEELIALARAYTGEITKLPPGRQVTTKFRRRDAMVAAQAEAAAQRRAREKRDNAQR
jgi:hypothetical protein